ncbi:MAG TPA: hypothetical protein VGK55_11300 [Actinomycetes bacterium]
MTQLTWILSYGEFWDVPRLFVVTVPDGLLVFDSPFDQDLDDYRPEYTVYCPAVERSEAPPRLLGHTHRWR